MKVHTRCQLNERRQWPLQAAVCRRNTSRRPAQSCDNQDAGLLSGSRPKAAADDNARVRADPAPSGHGWGARRH